MAVVWIVIFKNRLWKTWLKSRYGATADGVSRELGLREQDDFRPRLSFRGSVDGARVQVKWVAGLGHHRVRIIARRRFRRRSWTGRPDTPADQLLVMARTLVAEATR